MRSVKRFPNPFHRANFSFPGDWRDLMWVRWSADLEKVYRSSSQCRVHCTLRGPSNTIEREEDVEHQVSQSLLHQTSAQIAGDTAQSDTVGVGGLVVTSARDHSMCVVLDWCQCRQVRVGLHISLSVIGTQCQCHCEVVCQGKDWLILQEKCQSSGEDLTEAGAGNNRFASQLCSAIIPLRSPCHCVQVFSHTAHSHTLNK